MKTVVRLARSVPVNSAKIAERKKLAKLNERKNEPESRDEVIEPIKKPILDYKGPKANCAVYGAGLTKTGALGVKHFVSKPAQPELMNRPFRIAVLNSLRIRRVAAGLGFSLFASPSKVYGSGLNNFHQLGGPLKLGADTSCNYHISPTEIKLPQDSQIVSISCGRLHSLIGTSAGAFALGDNAHGQCGQDPETVPRIGHHPKTNSLVQVPIPSTSPVKQTHCLLDSSFVLLENGDLYAFGLSTDGQLGTGHLDMHSMPTKLNLPPIRLVAGSTDTVMAVDFEGQLYMWGQNEYGQFGDLIHEPQIPSPIKVPFDFDAPIRSAHASATSCVVATENGTVFVWGSMVLGSGPVVTRATKPLELSPNLFADARGGYKKVRRVIAGNTTMAAINEANQLFVWGVNRHAALALGHDKDQLFPLQVHIPSDVKSVALGPTHTLILAGTV